MPSIREQIYTPERGEQLRQFLKDIREAKQFAQQNINCGIDCKETIDRLTAQEKQILSILGQFYPGG